MSSILDNSYPFVFKTAAYSELPFEDLASDTEIRVRTVTRAMDGFQKEALVMYGPTGTSWRIVCDEGPWLNGTDLAPFPLAYFTTGLAVSLVSEVQALARQRDIMVRDIKVTVDNYYAMEGSIAKGTMTGSAMPVRVKFDIDADASKGILNELGVLAVTASPAFAIMSSALNSCFLLSKNGIDVQLDKTISAMGYNVNDPARLFDSVEPASMQNFLPDILSKGEDGLMIVTGGSQGSGSGLAMEQKRNLHLRGVCTLRDDGIKETLVQLSKPISGVYRILADESARFGGAERAPGALAYVAAGVSFCFMTQLGRYAHLAKQDLSDYRIVQDTWFSLPSATADGETAAQARPVNTHVFIDSSENDDAARKLVAMGEQSCYLHAAYRGSNRSHFVL
ncbi:MAG: OsmC family protein [Candidatus Thiodiazotropha sp.]|nr:OsmC family protein [Candidatus Thiodiazotropha sp.]MCM8885118.1 OsmC family protein [Candidatus Thiodiazotropha sp.]MCM8921403.1 OsmC family protein [Candidatus Thiodiazotropha sp.]